MKLWIRIALVVFLLVNIVIELILQFVIPQMDEEIIRLHGEKLKSVAATTAAYINGDDYEKLDFTNNSVHKNELFKNIQKSMLETIERVNIQENIYTVTFVSPGVAVYGVRTNNNSKTGDTLIISTELAEYAYREAYDEHDCSFTGFYENNNGNWLSGIAPIHNSNGDVVGVVQADHEASFVMAKIEGKHAFINYIRWLILPILLLISVLVAVILGNPITKATKRIEKIAQGDYREQKKVVAFGEVKKLLSSTELLRKTILEQQETIFNNIRQLEKKNQELEKSREEIKSSEELKTEFLALISHEIRTPINVLQNYLMLIEDEIDIELKNELKEIFTGSQEAFDRLVRTVDLIVTMSELQTDNFSRDVTNFQVAEVVKHSVEHYINAAENKNLSLTFYNQSVTSNINADKFLFKQVVDNLIDNAIKFTNEGGVDIGIEDTEEKVILKIRDTGIGIAEENRDKIFEVFVQEENGYSRSFEGNGLGLALVKKSMAIENAKLVLLSEKGFGSEFRLEYNKVKSDQLHVLPQIIQNELI